VFFSSSLLLPFQTTLSSCTQLIFFFFLSSFFLKKGLGLNLSVAAISDLKYLSGSFEKGLLLFVRAARMWTRTRNRPQKRVIIFTPVILLFIEAANFHRLIDRDRWHAEFFSFTIKSSLAQ